MGSSAFAGTGLLDDKPEFVGSITDGMITNDDTPTFKGTSKNEGDIIKVYDKGQYLGQVTAVNSDGKLDSRDVLWKQLSVWQDFNGDGASEVGEVKTLSELGFKEINFVSDGGVAQPAAGVIEYGKASVTMNDGSSMVAAQASFSLLDQTQWTQTASAVI